MSKIKKGFLPILMILAIFTLGFTPNSSVAAKADNTQDIVVVSGDEAEKWIDTTLDSVEKGEIKYTAPVSALALKESTVYTVGGGVTVVTVPVHEDYSLPSNVTVFFDENTNVLQTNEMLVTKNDAGNFQVDTYLDGLLVDSKDTEVSYKTDEEMLAEKPAEFQTFGVKKIAACLATVLGIGGTVATIIAIACGGSCAAPTPVTAPICAACIGAYAVIGTGGIAGAVACFK